MPAYNEEVHIHSSIQETLRAVDKFGCSYEIIVVDDGSKDRTYKEILRAAIKFQTDKYLGGIDYRNIQNMINMPMTAFQHGFENRKLEI